MKDIHLDVRYRTEHELRQQFPMLNEADQCTFFLNLCAAVQGRNRDIEFLYEIAQHLTPAQRAECKALNDATFTEDPKTVKAGTVSAMILGAQLRTIAQMETSFNWHHIDPILKAWGLYDLGFEYRFNHKSRYVVALKVPSFPTGSTVCELIFFLSRHKHNKTVLRVDTSLYHTHFGYDDDKHSNKKATSRGELFMHLYAYGITDALPYAREHKINSLL